MPTTDCQLPPTGCQGNALPASYLLPPASYLPPPTGCQGNMKFGVRFFCMPIHPMRVGASARIASRLA